MEAVKRLYDNSYVEYQETAASAMAYLETKEKEFEDNKTEEKKIKSVVREKKQKKSYLLNSILTVFMSIFYCVIILTLILIPLIKETEIQQLKVEFADYKSDINRLKIQISDLNAKFNLAENINTIEKIAIEQLGMQKPTEGQIRRVSTEEFYSLSEEDYIRNINLENIAEGANISTME